MKSSYTLVKYCLIFTFLIQVKTNSFAQDLGPSAYSTLTWDHISSVLQDATSGSTIGLTTDKKMYVWGTNIAFTIHKGVTTANSGVVGEPIWQTTPYYVPSPSGQTIKKVRIHGNSTTAGYTPPTYFSLSESGNIYAWGFNNGLLRSAWTNNGTTFPATGDSTKTSRVPVLISIPGESSFVDFDVPRNKTNYWIAIGTSGKAYHIGINDAIGTAATTIFNTLPDPAGVAVGFKYTNVWVSPFHTNPFVYLKGNDGKIYYTGVMLPALGTGVPSIYYYNSPTPTVTSNEQLGKILLITPREVPFPVGEDIVSMKLTQEGSGYTNYALSASGKAYMTGLWKIWFNGAGRPPYEDYRTYVVAPLKTPPVLNTDYHVRFLNSGNIDSLYTLKSFKEIALPPGATKIVEIETPSREDATTQATLVIGDDNRVWWSGTNASASPNIISSGNYLSVSNALGYQSDRCRDVLLAHTTNTLQWTVEAINYRGASKLFRSSDYTSGTQLGIISKTGRGYFTGRQEANTGTGKIYGSPYSFYPVPIANELLADCNPNPGTGGTWSSGPVAPTNTAVGTIDCSKTQLSPAPTFGTVSQLDLIVTINVTTAGSFTPLTVTGSGMTIANNVTSIATATTGIQTFHIPMDYDGTALGTMNFTVGSAGSCTADLTTKSTQIIKNVWTLNNCSAIVPGVISK